MGDPAIERSSPGTCLGFEPGPFREFRPVAVAIARLTWPIPVAIDGWTTDCSAVTRTHWCNLVATSGPAGTEWIWAHPHLQLVPLRDTSFTNLIKSACSFYAGNV